MTELETYSREQLIERVVLLQKTLQDARAKLENARGEVKNASALVSRSANDEITAWSLEKVAEKAHKLAALCVKGIEKQMKWQARESFFISFLTSLPQPF